MCCAVQALLKEDFDLDMELPLDRLCPAVPQKLNYIHWLEDLLALSPTCHAEQQVRGIDVGTGASCIYPLLAVAMHPRWAFVATEVDTRSMACASRNVALNGMQVSHRPTALTGGTGTLSADARPRNAVMIAGEDLGAGGGPRRVRGAGRPVAR
eukprot:COSAG01_NODE_898_length_12870_cov_27.573800_3_plen_154_part_00